MDPAIDFAAMSRDYDTAVMEQSLSSDGGHGR